MKRVTLTGGPFLPFAIGMLRSFGLAVGAAGAALFIRERQRRMAAERLAAAVLETLLRAIDANDAETGRHVRRVARYALILADAADLDSEAQYNVERIALFHDVGKISEALFDIIHDDTTLTTGEFEAIRTHPNRGADVLAPLAAFYPRLPTGVLAHHERWDGTGYPRALRGSAIPIEARIVAIADAFDAITYGRRYRNKRSASEAAEKLTEGRATQFDPDLIDLFLAPPVFEQVVEVLRGDRGPRPRRVRRRPLKSDDSPRELSFRWRTTTPLLPAPDPALQRSP